MSDSFSRAPFFVVGAVRSGTTLLRLMLGHHPSICRCEEMEFLTPALVGRAGWPELSAFRADLAKDRGFQLSGYAIPAQSTFPELADDLLAQRRALDARPLAGAVVHNHFDELPRIWPDARYVFLHRDPRDVARSCVEMGWAGTPFHGVRKWLDAERAWKRLCAQVPEPRRLELHFESLVEQPERELARVCRLLGLGFDPRMLEIDADTTYARPRRGASRSWRETASASEVAQVEARIDAALWADSGYAPSGIPALRLSAWARARIEWAEARGRVGFRIRRFGLGLWLASLVARRLPLRGLRDRTQARIDAIQNRHMK